MRARKVTTITAGWRISPEKSIELILAGFSSQVALVSLRAEIADSLRVALPVLVFSLALSGAFLAYGTVSAGRLPLMQNFPMIFSEPH